MLEQSFLQKIILYEYDKLDKKRDEQTLISSPEKEQRNKMNISGIGFKPQNMGKNQPVAKPNYPIR